MRALELRVHIPSGVLEEAEAGGSRPWMQRDRLKDFRMPRVIERVLSQLSAKPGTVDRLKPGVFAFTHRNWLVAEPQLAQFYTARGR